MRFFYSAKRRQELAEMIEGQLGADDLETERCRQKKDEETKTDDHQEAA